MIESACSYSKDRLQSYSSNTVRDVEAALAEALGSEAALSKSTVSRICEAIKDESSPGGPGGRCPRRRRFRLKRPGGRVG
jgi:hypothetical protein